MREPNTTDNELIIENINGARTVTQGRIYWKGVLILYIIPLLTCLCILFIKIYQRRIGYDRWANNNNTND